MILQYRSYAKYIAVLVTIALVAILFTQINLGDVISTLTNINPIYLAAGFILYVCSYFFRAWRFHLLLNKEVSIKDLFHIECVHNMMNNLLPARTGELSYIYLLKKINTRTTGEGVATLIVSRIFDAIALAIFFFCAILLIRDIPTVILDTIWLVAIGIIIFIIFLVLLLWYGRKFLFWIHKAITFLHIEQKHWVKYLMKKGDETVESLDQINILHNQIYCLVSSLLIWGFNCGMIYFLLAGMGFDLSYLSIIIGATFILLTTILPIQGIAGFGTTELIWTLVFVSLGLSKNAAIVSGFSYHILVILFFMILGIYGWLKIRILVS